MHPSRPAMLLALLFAAAPLHAETSAERAKRNYEQIVRGQKQIGDLSPSELAEVAELDRVLKSKPADKRSATQRCRDEEIKRAGGSPSELELRVIDLKCSQR